jgi:glycosyltransferase involved in cell wall biosynthesis
MTVPLSVVIPAYNEARRLPPTLEKIKGHLAGRPHEILVVDDGSEDDTAALATAAGVTVVRNEGIRG